MILYIIQAHENPPQVLKLISLLDDGEDMFLVNVDATAFAGFSAAAAAAMPASMRPRVIVRCGMPVTWGGFSQVLGWLDAYRFALRDAGDWEFAVLLSGACLPLRGPGRIRRHLAEGHRNGLRVHCCRWDWERSAVEAGPPVDEAQDWGALGYERHSLLGRVDTDIRGDVFGFVTDVGTTPAYHQTSRGEIVCQDMLSEKRLVIRGLSPGEYRRRNALMSRFPVRGGWMWAAFERSAMIELLEDRNGDEILEMLSTFLCPDEMVLPTLLRSSATIREDEVADRNLHLDLGFPADLSADDLERIEAADALFCRKVDYAAQPALVAFAERRVAED